MAPATHIDIQEHTFAGHPHRVDREVGVIFGVKVLGVTSKNGRTYSPKALAAAARLYEGIEVNIDHPDRGNPARERGIRESFGVLRNVTIRDDGVYADLHYVRSHDLAAQIAERAERFPDKLGLSHNARGNVSRRGGQQVVEDIELVRSVDIVTRPATVKGLFESEGTPMNNTATDPAIDPVRDPADRSLLVEMEGEEPRHNSPDAVATDPADDDRVKAAFRAAVIAAFDDESLDMKATLMRIKQILAAHDKLSGGSGAAASTDNAGNAKAETSESHRVVELESRLALLESEKHARTLLESADVEPAEEFVEAVALLDSHTKKQALIGRLPRRDSTRPAPRSLRPSTSAPIDTLESTSADNIPEFHSPQSVVSFLRGHG